MNKKKLYVLLFFVSCSYSFQGFGQEVDIAPYIKAWKTKDKTQTLEFEKTIALFVNIPDGNIHVSEKHLQVIEAGKNYLQKNPDKRVAVRLLMYEIWVKQSSVGKVEEGIIERLKNAIPIAYQLKDQQLLSELYVMYAGFNGESPEYITYTAKAFRIQEEIGQEYFPKYCAVLFGLSNALYHANNFKESIIYGEKYTECWNLDPNGYVFWRDLMGSNHFKLKEYDKAYDYYNQLLEALENGNDFQENFRVRWQGIAKASIGSVLFEQGKIEESIPYLQTALEIMQEYEVWNTAASSQNILAKIDYNNGNYETALKKWKEACQWVLKSKVPIQEPLQLLKYQISGNIAKAFYKLNNIDSTFHYLNKARQEQLVYEKRISERNFDLINANLNFEEATNKLEISQQKLERERLLRNGILAGVILLGIIGLLIIRERQIRIKYRHRMLVREKKIAEERAEEARKNIEVFKKNIAEKEQLIEILQNNTDTEPLDAEKLSEYVLVTEEEWFKFKDDFSKAYPGFLPELRKIIDHPTPAEERLSCLISLNLSNTQIAAMLGISTDSVARSKRRIKNRITLPENTSLEEYICQLHVL